MQRKLIIILMVLISVSWTSAARADFFTLDDLNRSVTVTGIGMNTTEDHPLAASATFSLDPAAHGGTLVIELCNLETAIPATKNAVVPADILTGLVWTNTTQTKGLAQTFSPGPAPPGAVADGVLHATGHDTDVGFSWQYKFSSSLETSSGQVFNQGISVVGRDFWAAKAGGNFPSAHGSEKLTNINWGIAPPGYTGANGNPKVNGAPLSADEVTFVFYNVGSSYEIGDPAFLYGTSSDEPGFPGIVRIPVSHAPIPGSALLLGTGLLGLLGLRGRRRVPAGCPQSREARD